ncbi:MAG: hypothetical protein AAB508_05235, partial [Patescibacteria group bacterium]
TSSIRGVISDKKVALAVISLACSNTFSTGIGQHSSVPSSFANTANEPQNNPANNNIPTKNNLRIFCSL